jgi:predicted RND superfamily exporter protein
MKLRERILGSIAEFILRRYKLLLGIGLVLALVSVYFAGGIRMNTQIKDMLSKGNSRVVAYDEMTKDFGGASLIITLEGGTKERMAAAAEELCARMTAKPELSRYIRSISLKLEKDFVLDWGLLLQKPADIRRMRALFERTSILPFIVALNENLESSYTGDQAEEDLETSRQEIDAVSSMARIGNFAETLRAAVEAPGMGVEDRAAALADSMVFGDLYTFSQDGSMLLFAVTMNFDMASNLDACTGILADINALGASLGVAYPEIRFGGSGDIAVQSDENAAMSSDMLIPSILAYAAILVLFVFSFRQLRSVVFAMICLALGILFNFGVIGAAFGELNIVTSMIASLLIGMGIDYGIQVTTSFGAFREEGKGFGDSIRLTFKMSGFGIILAAATTSASFFVLIACASKAMKQLGFVAGVGILTCLAAMIFILPAMIVWLGKRSESRSLIPQIDYGFLERIGAFAARRRLPVLIISGLVTAALGVSAFNLNIEYDMMELEPQNGPSIKTYRKILDKFEMNPNSALVVADSVDEARILAAKLESLPAVAEVQSVSAFLPSAEEQAARLAEIALVRAEPPRASAMAYRAADIDALAEEVRRLEDNLMELGDISVAGLGEGNRIVRKRDAMIREAFGAEVGKSGAEVFRNLIAALRADPGRAAARLTALDAAFSAKASAAMARMAAVDRPIAATDLPPSLADNFLDKKTGKRNLVTVYPKASATATNEGLRRYDASLREAAPGITGTTPLFLDFFDEMLSESKTAALYVGVLVLLFAFASFRSVRYTLIAAVPPIISLVLLFGTLPLIGWKINALNLITLPLNIGIGVAYGTYLLQRYLAEGRDLTAALKYTSKAIFLSAFTTMVGFGSLGVAGSFRMLAGFGVVLFIGIGYCYLTTMLVIPALLGDRGEAREAAPVENRGEKASESLVKERRES